MSSSIVSLLVALMNAFATTPGLAQPAAGDDVKVDGSRYGQILVDGHGRTLYLFTRDRGGKSRCYGECAKAWPPQLLHGDHLTGQGLDRSKLGATTRRGGARQVTYAGHPLYYYVGDRRPGQILCQNVVEFGGTWLVVSPAGRAVRGG
jgi:predicted lipoprotein with Yx(FWY)xxD motif